MLYNTGTESHVTRANQGKLKFSNSEACTYSQVVEVHIAKFWNLIFKTNTTFGYSRSVSRKMHPRLCTIPGKPENLTISIFRQVLGLLVCCIEKSSLCVCKRSEL